MQPQSIVPTPQQTLFKNALGRNKTSFRAHEHKVPSPLSTPPGKLELRLHFSSACVNCNRRAVSAQLPSQIKQH